MPINKQSVSIPLAIVAAGALIAVAVYFNGYSVQVGSLTGDKNLGSALSTGSSNTKIAPVSGSDHILGSPDAQAVVVEYSDLECPFCKAFHNTMHEILNVYGGKVAWVYRQFPIPQLHSRAPKEAQASECAADQGGNTVFWTYIDKVFARTGSNDTLDPAELTNIANELHLDMKKFNDCLASTKHVQDILDSSQAAIVAGAQGTPYSVIITKGGDQIVINGAETFESVKAKLDSVLK